MTKRNRVIYWIATLWLSLGMVSTGIVQILGIKENTDFIIRMGYPEYFITMLGVWKILGVVAVLVPKFPLVKEWAYAGFFFMMSGAVLSHIILGHSAGELFPPFLLFVLTVLSWYFRPADRRLVAAGQ